jgi:hypothetical protein
LNPNSAREFQLNAKILLDLNLDLEDALNLRPRAIITNYEVMNIDDEFFIEEIEDPKDKYVYNKLKN